MAHYRTREVLQHVRLRTAIVTEKFPLGLTKDDRDLMRVIPATRSALVAGSAPTKHHRTGELPTLRETIDRCLNRAELYGI